MDKCNLQAFCSSASEGVGSNETLDTSDDLDILNRSESTVSSEPLLPLSLDPTLFLDPLLDLLDFLLPFLMESLVVSADFGGVLDLDLAFGFLFGLDFPFCIEL